MDGTGHTWLASLCAPSLADLWSSRRTVLLEREQWLAVMRAQAARGLDISPAQIADYERVASQVDLASIRRREMRTKHDVKARIEEFNALAGHEVCHLGMTSSDVVDNISLVRMARGLAEVGERYQRPDLVAEALRWPYKGLRGPVGTSQDLVDLLGSEAAEEVEAEVASALGMGRVLGSVNQVYPRSLDLLYATLLLGCCRTRTGWAIGQGLMAMVVAYQGDTWNEGDVSQSAVRRVALPALVWLADADLAGAFGSST